MILVYPVNLYDQFNKELLAIALKSYIPIDRGLAGLLELLVQLGSK